MADVLQNRDDDAMFFCVNAKPIVPLITRLAPASRELAMANAIMDLNSLNSIAGRAGVGEHGVFLDLGIRLDQGHHNLAYNLLRTPPITRETLACVLKGAAGKYKDLAEELIAIDDKYEDGMVYNFLGRL